MSEDVVGHRGHIKEFQQTACPKVPISEVGRTGLGQMARRELWCKKKRED